MADIIAYYRVSTKKQGESGLGLEGQEAAVQSYARQTGATIKANYVEVESWKRADRPQLAKALGSRPPAQGNACRRQAGPPGSQCRVFGRRHEFGGRVRGMRQPGCESPCAPYSSSGCRE